MTTPDDPSVLLIGERRVVAGIRHPAIGNIYRHGALVEQVHGPGTCGEVLVLDDWLCEPDGRPTGAALVMLADSAGGWAVSSVLPPDLGMVTARLRVDLYRPLGTGERAVVAQARAVHVDRSVGFGRVEMTTTAGGDPVGAATMRSAHVVSGGLGRTDATGGTPPAPPVERLSGSIDDVLGTVVRTVDDDRAVVTVRARAALNNAMGNVHGGMVVAMAERAERALLARLGAVGARLLDVDAAYLRPLPGDETSVAVESRVVAATRRFVELTTVVTRADGRPAATVGTTYARDDLTPLTGAPSLRESDAVGADTMVHP